MQKLILPIFIVFLLTLSGCVEFDGPDHISSTDRNVLEFYYDFLIVQFEDTTYVNHVLAYEKDVTPSEPDWKFKKLSMRHHAYPKRFLDSAYIPWRKMIDNYYMSTPFMPWCWPFDADCPYDARYDIAPSSLQTQYPFSDLCVLSFRWEDIAQSNYTYEYERWDTNTGFEWVISDVQWSMDSLMARNPIKNVYSVTGKEISEFATLNFYDSEQCLKCVQKMLLTLQEQGNLDEWLLQHKLDSYSLRD